MGKQVEVDCITGETRIVEVPDIFPEPINEPVKEPTQEERISALEAAMLELLLGG